MYDMYLYKMCMVPYFVLRIYVVCSCKSLIIKCSRISPLLNVMLYSRSCVLDIRFDWISAYVLYVQTFIISLVVAIGKLLNAHTLCVPKGLYFGI